MTPKTSTPVNRQAALFLSRKRHTNTVEEALDGAMTHITQGCFKTALASIFASDDFGPEPLVKFVITIRRDVAAPGKYAYSARTSVSHHIGDEIKYYGLKG